MVEKVPGFLAKTPLPNCSKKRHGADNEIKQSDAGLEDDG